MDATLVEALIRRAFVSASGNVGQIQLPAEVKEAEEKAKKAAEAAEVGGEDAEKHAKEAEKAKAAAAEAVVEMQTLEVDWTREPAEQDKAELCSWLLLMTGASADHLTHVWPDMPAKAKPAHKHEEKAEHLHEGHGGSPVAHQEEHHGISGLFHKGDKEKRK